MLIPPKKGGATVDAGFRKPEKSLFQKHSDAIDNDQAATQSMPGFAKFGQLLTPRMIDAAATSGQTHFV